MQIDADRNQILHRGTAFIRDHLLYYIVLTSALQVHNIILFGYSLKSGNRGYTLQGNWEENEEAVPEI
jgi:hypothetical protein